MRCCMRDGGRPSDVVLRGQASNHPVLRWLKTVVVSDREKARSTCQVGTRKAFQNRLPDVGWASLTTRLNLGSSGN